MIKVKLLLILLLISNSLISGQNIPVIPKPVHYVFKGNNYLQLNKIFYSCTDRYEHLINVFSLQLNNYLNTEFPIQKTSGSKVNLLLKKVNKNEVPGHESYCLDLTPQKAIIAASSDTGLFYGLQTFLQLAINGRNYNTSIRIPCIEIIDQPRYAWRGLMLDESRHFFGKEKVMQLIDWMAFYKLNRFHWHLTDVPGWRIEILKYPKLTSVGGMGNHHDPLAPAKFYTQTEIKEIIQYASSRYIEIIPEIDMPGHATAANRAYPEYSGGGSEKYPDFTFNPGKEETYQYLTEILKEVAHLFPSKFIHLGGDEVHFGNQQWSSNPDIQELMLKHQLPNLQAVEFYFIKRMADTVFSLNKTMIGWDEIVNAGIPANKCITMWWRHDKPEQLYNSLEFGYRTILCPRIPLYFDFVQDSSHLYGRRWNGDFVTLKKILDFHRIYGDIISKYSNQVLGIQANIWTETIQSGKRLDFMTFPRIAALSEIAWNNKPSPDYKEFLIRLSSSMRLYDNKHIYYYDPVNPNNSPEPDVISK